jgi:putative DNA primase/helicase
MGSAINAPVDNEFELASSFSDRYGNDLRYTAAWGRWSVWNGQLWVKDETLLTRDWARGVCSDAAAAADGLKARQRISREHTVDAVERLARADRRHAATVDQWDSDPWLLSTPGGIVDLHTGIMRPAKREDYATKITAVAPGGECPLWLAFLSRVTNGNKDLQDYLQRMCGYALTGMADEQALFFLYGTGANGKSVCMKTIAGVMGGYAMTAPIEMFAASFNDRHPTELARLQGARLVTATEPKEGGRWDEAKIKQLTGGDRIAARYMRQDFFEFTPQCKFLIAGNHKPGLSSVDEAIRGRLKLLPFTVTIPVSERDLGLADKLREEWPGILQWGIDGCLAWQLKGLRTPETVRDATDVYLDDEDEISQWIEDRCEKKDSYFTLFKELYDNFTDWCLDNRGNVVGDRRKWFSRQLQSHGFESYRNSRERGFKGIRLKG